MTWDELMYSLKRKMMGSPEPLRDSDGTTYGPAQSRYTRVPIDFEHLEGIYGKYNPAKIGLGPKITIDPTELNSTQEIRPGVFTDTPRYSDVLRHEDVHHILHPLASTLRQGLNDNKPFPLYKKLIEKKLGAEVDPMEIPAYIAEQDSNIGIPRDLRAAYIRHFSDMLKQLSPSMSEQYARRAGKVR